MDYIVMVTKMIVGIVSLILVMRLLGKKELSAAGPLDIVYSVALGDFIGEAIYDDKIPWYMLVFVIVAWTLIIYLIDYISYKSPFFAKITQGSPEILIKNGKLNRPLMRHNRLTLEEVQVLLREQGCFDIKDVKIAMLETNGHLSILKNE